MCSLLLTTTTRTTPTLPSAAETTIPSPSLTSAVVLLAPPSKAPLAVSCTSEALDKRNETNWASNLRFPVQDLKSDYCNIGWKSSITRISSQSCFLRLFLRVVHALISNLRVGSDVFYARRTNSNKVGGMMIR
ncbi:iron-regulated ABC transporter membrane componentSufB [Striga asiatica]|uniref:Iron-regulated ABC transporter membrane componentSufB n=1 Tax=Striga asiatica TaxID=4170 RepID=A0A5A7PR63_STRAF|nr:iron-regulated ABC transporter membrane componentSufB [Striga asiatica]